MKKFDIGRPRNPAAVVRPTGRWKVSVLRRKAGSGPKGDLRDVMSIVPLRPGPELSPQVANRCLGTEEEMSPWSRARLNKIGARRETDI